VDTDLGKVWYFAYGSNLCVEQVVRRTGPVGEGEDSPRVARLPGYRLVFNMRGDDGLVYANIIQPGDEVIGVLYRCSEAALASLDEYEEGYARRQVRVTLKGGATREALAYVARPECTSNGGGPSPAYLGIIIQGARRHGFPEAYIRSIEAAARSRREVKRATDTGT
jgi:gamma-glutamylcyclotransferase